MSVFITSTSTVSNPFRDTVVLNTDVRILRNDQNEPILMYTFFNKDTIIITTKIKTLEYILGQLLAVRVIQ